MNLNFQKSDFPKWQCRYDELITKFLVTSFDITCENPVPSQQPPSLYKEYKCLLSFTLKMYENAVAFKETSYLVFNKLKQTKGKIPILQLKCIDDSSDDLCTKSTVEQANCTNLGYENVKIPIWHCTFTGLNPGFSAIEDNVICENPDGSKPKRYSEYYKKESCSLEYNLRFYKLPEHDKKSDEKLPEKPTTDPPKDNTFKFLLMVSVVPSVLFGVCICTSVFYYYRTRSR